VTAAISLPIGAVRLAERHLKHDPPRVAEIEALRADVDATLRDATIPPGSTIVATAGTATTLATLYLELDGYDPAKIHGVRVSRGMVFAILARLCTMTTEARRAMRGMEPKRADVIPAGVLILAGVLDRADAKELVISDRGIRWGVAYELNARGMP